MGSSRSRPGRSMRHAMCCVLLLAVLATASGMHTQKERYLDRDSSGSSSSLLLRGAAAAAAKHTRSLLQFWGAGSQAQAQAQAQSFGGFSQAQAQAQAQAGGFGSGAQAQAQAQSGSFEGGGGWNQPFAGFGAGYGGYRGPRRGQWWGRRMLSVRSTLAADASQAVAKQDAADQVRRGGQPFNYGPYGGGSGNRQSYPGGGSNAFGNSGGPSSAWQNAASGGNNFWGG